jgi:16S rRNA (cytidine1402-2'-O)-methyltransferase
MRIQKTFKNNLPTIFLVTTPIGNMDDFSFRSIETLKNVDFIYCEDTRTSGILLNKFEIKTKTGSLHKFNELEKVDEIISRLRQNQNIALISDAGVPCINDPGMYLLEKLSQDDSLDFNISAVGAGPAYVHALVMSSYFCQKHFYIGFVDKKETKIISELQEIVEYAKQGERISVCLYESVHRIKKTLQIIFDEFKNDPVKIAIAREITKINEEIVRLSINEIPDFLKNEELVEKGEFCIVLNFDFQSDKKAIGEDEIISLAKSLVEQGLKKKEALKQLRREYEFDMDKIYKIL